MNGSRLPPGPPLGFRPKQNPNPECQNCISAVPPVPSCPASKCRKQQRRGSQNTAHCEPMESLLIETSPNLSPKDKAGALCSPWPNFLSSASCATSLAGRLNGAGRRRRCLSALHGLRRRSQPAIRLAAIGIRQNASLIAKLLQSCRRIHHSEWLHAG